MLRSILKPNSALLAGLFCLGSAGSGCVGTITDAGGKGAADPVGTPGDPNLPTGPNGMIPGGSNPGGPNGMVPGGTGQIPGGNNPSSIAACTTADARPKLAPIRRLTATEYANTIRDLFPKVTIAPQTIAVDGVVEGFTNNTTAQAPSPLLIEQYRTAASAVAAAARQGLASWAPCDGSGNGAACLDQLAQSLAARAYRRPLSDAEKTQVSQFATGAFGEFGFQDGVQVVVQGLLQTPQFLYRAELGDAKDAHDGIIRLTGYEVASRLSFLFWQTMPDPALMDAAAKGGLDNAAGVEAQARRLMGDARAKNVVADFHRQWLRLDRIAAYTPDAEVFPAYTTPVKDALVAASAQFMSYAFWDKGTIAALLTDPTMFVNDALAALYGLPKPGSGDLVKTAFPADQRAGLLTQPGILAQYSHSRTHSSILRGVFMRDAIMCTPVPSPPLNVSTTIPPMTVGEKVTTRQHVEQTHTQPVCAGCHNAIDGVGFTFENYDAIGRYVTTENGLPIDASGRLIGVPGLADQDVPNAVGMAKVLAGSRQVHECVANHWYRFAMGRGIDGDPAAQCLVEQLASQLTQGGDLKEMLIQLTKSEAFRYRPMP
jgi:hypothetical protein